MIKALKSLTPLLALAIVTIAGFAFLAFGFSDPKKDSLNLHRQQQLTDSTWLISWKDYTELKDKMLLEMPTKYGLPIMQWFEQKLQDRIEEWKRKNKKP